MLSLPAAGYVQYCHRDSKGMLQHTGLSAMNRFSRKNGISNGINERKGMMTMANSSLFMEIFEYMKMHKRFWLLPLIIILIIFGALLFFTESSAIAPFIYTLF